jgi:hypothetical protein
MFLTSIGKTSRVRKKEKEKEKETQAFATRDGCQTSDALSFVCFFLVAAATSASKRGVSSSRLRC